MENDLGNMHFNGVNHLLGNYFNQRNGVEMKTHDIQHKLDLHTTWRNSGGQDGEQAVFANCDLGGFNFTGMDLSLIIFDYANLSNADFLRSEIRDCSFYRANLSGCKNMLIWQAPKQAGRICYSVNHKHFAKHKLGCFWGDTAEAISKIKSEYGANSLYEEALILYSYAVMGGESLLQAG